MKIIYLHQYFNTANMSGGTRSYEMARRFVAWGHDVHMITTRRTLVKRKTGWLKENVDGINVHWLYVPYSNHMNFIERIKAFLHFALLAGPKAVSLKGDIVFATSTPLTIALPGVYAAKRLNVPMVFEVRDLWPELPIAVGALRDPLLVIAARWIERFAYKNSVRVVALSPGMADGVVQTGYPKDKVFVISNGCDIDLFQVREEVGKIFLEAHPDLKRGPLVVYTGTLGAINGVDYLVEIAHALQRIDSSVRFLIAGDGKEINLVKEKAARLGVLDKNFWMIPPVSKSEMPGLLSAATVATSLFIDLPEMWNNSANKFFDALAAGRPVAINYQGWQADLLEKSGSGIVIPAKDAARAAEILHAFLSDGDRLRIARRAAAQLARDQFSRDKLAKRLLSVLEEAHSEHHI